MSVDPPPPPPPFPFPYSPLGPPPRYGEFCQLKHVKSGKFVSFKQAYPAEQPANKGKGRLLKTVANEKVHVDDGA